MARPHDIADLFLAPLVLKIDAELETLRAKSQDELLMYIALSTNHEPRSIDERRRFLLEAVTRFHDMHGWVATWDLRGLRLANDDHHLVLGVPPAVSAYLALADESLGAPTA